MRPRTAILESTPTQRPGSIVSDDPASGWQLLSPAAPNPRRASPWLSLLLISTLVALNAYMAFQHQLLPRTGMVVQIQRGSLEVQDNKDGPWVLAEPERLIREGSRLKTSPASVVLIRFFDESVMRLEAAGDWGIVSLQGSRNGRISRVTVRQYSGIASYVSQPVRTDPEEGLHIAFPWATFDLAGVATVSTATSGTTRAHIHQGRGKFLTDSETLDGVQGQEILIESQEAISLLVP